MIDLSIVIPRLQRGGQPAAAVAGAQVVLESERRPSRSCSSTTASRDRSAGDHSGPARGRSARAARAAEGQRRRDRPPRTPASTRRAAASWSRWTRISERSYDIPGLLRHLDRGTRSRVAGEPRAGDSALRRLSSRVGQPRAQLGQRRGGPGQRLYVPRVPAREWPARARALSRLPRSSRRC